MGRWADMMRIDEGQQNGDEAVNIIEFFTLLLLNSLLLSLSLSLSLFGASARILLKMNNLFHLL